MAAPFVRPTTGGRRARTTSTRSTRMTSSRPSAACEPRPCGKDRHDRYDDDRGMPRAGSLARPAHLSEHGTDAAQTAIRPGAELSAPATPQYATVGGRASNGSARPDEASSPGGRIGLVCKKGGGPYGRVFGVV